MEFRIALTGNPNVGKTSLYNRLTRSFEHVGNWHGVTVKRISKKITFGGKSVVIDDLPGLYSLSACSGEEGVARDCILGGEYDVIVNICEVNNLLRNLYLTLQLLELNVPVVLVINMIDELEKRGKALDIEKLQSALGIPVLAMSAKYKIDAGKLLSICEEYAENFSGNKIELTYLDKLDVEKIISLLSKDISAAEIKPVYAAVKLLENDSYVAEKLNLNNAKKRMIAASSATQSRVAALRYEFIEAVADGVIISKADSGARDKTEGAAGKLFQKNIHNASEYEKTAKQSKSIDNLKRTPQNNGLVTGNKKVALSKMYLENAGKIDKIVLNKYLALPIFLLTMLLIFVVTFGFLGKWASDGLAWVIDRGLYQPVTEGLKSVGSWQWFIDLVGEGVIMGVGGILVFLPQIVLLFFFLAMLEDSGYISRVAFMTDGLFRKIGLSGRSAFTMLMGFGCSATAVLTARGLDDENMRKKTVLLTPFMSCSARLPVYSAIGGAFFFGANPLIIFVLYFLGAFVAFVIAAILQKSKRLRSGKQSFIMEMPPYRIPTFERVRQIIWNNSKVFIIRVGTLIFGLNVFVWLLSNFSFMGYTPGTEYQSFLEIFSGFVAPVFAPLGFGNWEAVTALMSGFVAKEAVLSTVESFGGVAAIFSGSEPKLAAFCFLVFTLLYVPCVATLGAIAKELGTKWAIASFVLQIGVAYTVALAIRGIGLLFIYNAPLAIFCILGCMLVAAIALSVRHLVKNRHCKNCGGCNKNSCEKK